MNKRLGVLVATIVMAFTLYGVAWAECTLAPNTRHFSLSIYNPQIGQSWTAPCTETLDKVEFYPSEANFFDTLGDITLSIYQGLPSSGTLLTSQTITITKDTLKSVRITQDVTIQEGVQYSFYLRHASEDISLSVGNEAYSGGMVLYGNGSTFAAYDLFFSIKLGRTAAAPTVTTTAATNVTHNAAVSGGNVTDGGSASVTAKGVCWNTTGSPVATDAHTDEGAGTGVFTSNLSGLTPNTTYFVRAYATSPDGTGYGSEETFTTLEEPTAVPLSGGLGLAAFGAALAGLAWRRARTARKR